MSLRTLSRILRALSTRRQTGAEPYCLIEQDYAPDDRRCKIIRHSPKGHASISRVTDILSQDAV